jgi:hypothetical protein
MQFYLKKKNLWFPLLGEIERGARGMTVHPKVDVLIFSYIPKTRRRRRRRRIKIVFLCHDPLTFVTRENLFYLSQRKTRWTMTMENLGLKIGHLGTSSSMIILTFQ